MTIEASTKSRKATPHRNASVSLPRRVARNDGSGDTRRPPRSNQVSERTNLSDRVRFLLTARLKGSAGTRAWTCWRRLRGLFRSRASPRSSWAAFARRGMGWLRGRLRRRTGIGGWLSPAPCPMVASVHRVTGIGGVFIRARDAEALRRWYSEHLGIAIGGDSGAQFTWTSGVRQFSRSSRHPRPSSGGPISHA